MAVTDLVSDSDIEPSSDIELAGSASVDLEPANVTSSRLLDVLKLEKLKTLKREGLLKRVTDVHPDATTVLDLKAFYFLEQVIPAKRITGLSGSCRRCITKHQSIRMVG